MYALSHTGAGLQEVSGADANVLRLGNTLNMTRAANSPAIIYFEA
jgi:hypothetical protein